MLSENKIPHFEEILKSAGNILLTFPKENLEKKGNVNDNLKTNIDDYLQNYISNELRKISNIPIISEEDKHHDSRKRPDEYFLIDPLDGTRSYVEGFQTYATQIAVIVENKAVMSFIYLPTVDEYYSGYLGGGSFINGIKLHECLMEKPISITDNYKHPSKLIKELMEKSTIINYIESGSLAYKMCLIAKNSAQVFLKETKIADWDIAPAKLILEEIGGTVSLLNGAEYNLEGNFKKSNLLVTSNQVIKHYILDIVKNHD